MTSVTETEHGVPDAGRTEVATKMNSWPCVCGRIPPQTWWLFPICKQEAPVWKGLPDPTLFIYFPVFRVLGRDHKLPLPVLQAAVCSPQILQRVDLGCGTWGKQCSLGGTVWGVLRADPQRPLFLRVWSLHTLTFPERLCGSWQRHHLARGCRSV